MAAFYDTYNYLAYWHGRDYEHEAEVIALRAFLSKLGKVKTILEVGAGFGRLAPLYINNKSTNQKIILSDPCSKQLKFARKNLVNKKIKFLQASLNELPNKIKPHSIDLLVIVRVLHHIDNLDETFDTISRLLKKDGFLILEFANKRHLKATISEFFRGNFTFLLDIFPKDLRKHTSSKIITIPFNNYHPDNIFEQLKKHKFKAIEVRSVSNIRSPILKKMFPRYLLIAIEKHFQKLLAKISFGPSLFVLSKFQ